MTVIGSLPLDAQMFQEHEVNQERLVKTAEMLDIQVRRAQPQTVT